MILYFSATGNCKYVATRLTQAIGQEIHSIVDCIRNGQYDFSDDTIGVISPTYDWGLLSIMKEFLEKASFQTDYLYFIATYGTTHGAIGYMANKAIRGKTINAFYVVRMVDTWTPIFDLSTPGKIAKYTKKTETRIDRVIRDISKRRINRHMPPGPRHSSPNGLPSHYIKKMCDALHISAWRAAASVADCAQRNAPYRRLRCTTGTRSG